MLILIEVKEMIYKLIQIVLVFNQSKNLRKVWLHYEFETWSTERSSLLFKYHFLNLNYFRYLQYSSLLSAPKKSYNFSVQVTKISKIVEVSRNHTFMLGCFKQSSLFWQSHRVRDTFISVFWLILTICYLPALSLSSVLLVGPIFLLREAGHVKRAYLKEQRLSVVLEKNARCSFGHT